MEPIDPTSLSNVRGGAGILGSLLGNAGPILNGVASIIGASKAGKGGAEAAPPQAPPPPPTPAAAAPGMIPTGDPNVSVSVSINGVPVR